MILDWRSFSRRPEIKNLPMNEQLRKFEAETKRLTELNWFIDTQIAIGGSKPGAAAPGFTGQVIDGPINAANVAAFSAAGAPLGTATTNALGVFTFADELPVGTTFTATGGTDSITGIAYTGTMRAEVSSDVSENVTISPITTFAKYLKDEKSITYDQAIEDLFLSSSGYFGQALDYNNRETILKKDFNAEALNGETEAIAALAVASFMEGACEIMSAYEEGEGGASTTKKDAAYLAMAKQMATFTSSLDISACLEEVASDEIVNEAGETDLLVNTKRTRTNLLLSNFKTDVFAVMDEQDKAPNYLVTKLNVLNRSGKKFAETEVVSIKGAEGAGAVGSVNVTVSTKFNAESGSLAQIEEGVANKTVATPAGEYTPHQLLHVTFGPMGMFGADVFNGSNRGTFHTVDDEIGIGTILYANSDVEAAQGATATAVSTWEDKTGVYQQFGYSGTVNMIDHLHSNSFGILGDNLTSIINYSKNPAGDIIGYAAEKFYKIQGKASGSNTLWRVTDVYEGNPRKDNESFSQLEQSRYSPVTQSYEFPPMDITIVSASAGFKIVTQEAIENEEEPEESVPEVSFPLHNVKFYYTASAGTHLLSGSRADANNSFGTYIQSNTHPNVKLWHYNAGYYLQHQNRHLFKTNENGLYQGLYDNSISKPFGEPEPTGKWIPNHSNVVDFIDGCKVTQVSGEKANAQLIFSGSNLAEGIS